MSNVTWIRSLFILLLALSATSCTIHANITDFTAKLSTPSTPLVLSAESKVVQEYGVASVRLTLSTASSEDLSFNYYTQDQTAIAGVDYYSVSGNVTIPVGTTEVFISVPVADNVAKNESKKFLIQVSGNSSKGISSQTSEVEIQDDDLEDISSGFTTLSKAKNSTMCAITNLGALKCWGNNQYAQVGDGTLVNRSTPTDVVGLGSGVVSVANGLNHSCALLNTGGVKCWGRNNLGQIGDGTNFDRLTAVDVSGLTSGVSSIDIGGNFTCAQLSTGGVKCWGNNGWGQLGDTTTVDKNVPTNVSGLASGVAAISLGTAHACALTTGGGVKCWGYNNTGAVGDGTGIAKSAPVNVTGLTSGVASIAMNGNHSCAITTGGALKCWGQNDYGQLGDGTTTNRNSQISVPGFGSGVTAVYLGGLGTCVTSSGSTSCWGYNAQGQVADGTITNQISPVVIPSLSTDVAQIVLTGNSGCLLTTAGGLKCWGYNNYGQLGDGNQIIKLKNSDVASFSSGALSISAGMQHSCAVNSAGAVKCWGYNFNGQLGDGTTALKNNIVDVVGLSSGALNVKSGNLFTCALTQSGGVKCWGGNTLGQLGDGTSTNRTSPVDVVGLASGVSSIAIGNSHTCALMNSGSVKCWGNNTYGQLGSGTLTATLTPVDVIGLSGSVSNLILGDSHTCALLSTGSIKCWGRNFNGQLGDGTTTDSLSPVDVIGLDDEVISAAAGDSHSCAVLKTGNVKCWGYNFYGQLGDGTNVMKITPVGVVGLNSKAKSIFAKSGQTCILTNLGGMQCWGRNDYGQLGDGTTTNRSNPMEVLGFGSGVSEVALSSQHSCAMMSNGSLKCWGQNNYYQLGSAYNYCSPGFVKQP